MDEKEIHEFYTNKVINQSKEEITAWFKSRTIVAAITLTVLGFVGINVLVYQAVRESMEQQLITTYQALGKVTAQSDDYGKELNAAKKMLREYESEVTALRQGASDIDNQFNELHESLEAKNRRSIIQFQITSVALETTITDFVSALGTISKDGADSLTIKDEIEEIKSSLDNLNKVILKFKNNRRYLIEVVALSEPNNTISNDIIDSLSNIGYEVRYYSRLKREEVEKFYRLNEGDIQPNSITVVYEAGGKEAANDAMRHLSTHFDPTSISLLPSPNKSKSGQISVGIIL